MPTQVKRGEKLIVLVTGGRDYGDREKVFATLDRLNVELLIHGGATGADLLAAEWAEKREVNALRVPAKWKAFKNAAGPLRNEEMARMKPDLCVAFPGGRGTANMVATARASGIEVREVNYEERHDAG